MSENCNEYELPVRIFVDLDEPNHVYAVLTTPFKVHGIGTPVDKFSGYGSTVGEGSGFGRAVMNIGKKLDKYIKEYGLKTEQFVDFSNPIKRYRNWELVDTE